MNSNAFQQHLTEAIQINKQRWRYYQKQAGALATIVSASLITSEYACLPIAKSFDRQAIPFQRAGVPILINDFVPMQVKPMETVPLFRSTAALKSVYQLKRWLSYEKQSILASVSQNLFSDASKKLIKLHKSLHEHQKNHLTNYAMTIHLVESAGLAATNAIFYHQQEEIRGLKAFCRRFIGLQIKVIDSGLLLDYIAQRCHAKGVGILINDLPDIPFGN